MTEKHLPNPHLVRELNPEELHAVSGGTNTWDSETDTSTWEEEKPDTEYWT